MQRFAKPERTAHATAAAIVVATHSFPFEGVGGTRLSGRLEVADGAVRAWAVFAHCFTCGKDGLAAVRISRALAAAGIGVLRFDFAGLGESEGDFERTTFATNVGDLTAAALAMEKAGMPPSLLIGHSLGGAAALAAAAALPNVRAVATLGAPFDVEHVLRNFDPVSLKRLEADGEADVLLAGRRFRIGRGFLEDVREQQQAKRIAELQRALLVLHAPGDALVGIDQATAIFAAAKHPKSFVSLDGADHLLGKAADANYSAAVIAAWASRYLGSAEAGRRSGQAGSVLAEETGAGRFQVMIHAGETHFVADEPESVGGLGSGPTPYDLLSASLAACTTMTLRLYAEREGLRADRIRTCVGYSKDRQAPVPDLFVRNIAIEGTLSGADRAALLAVADRCPVHRTLARGARIETQWGEPPAVADAVESHERRMEQAVGTPRQVSGDKHERQAS